jgi:hypothetical protein
MAAQAYIDPSSVQELLGDLTVSGSIDLDAAASDAASEMNIRLGERYVVPLDIDHEDLASHHRDLIKLINARLAAGNLIMATATATEYHELHRWGEYLREMALTDLDLIVSGRVVLGGQTEQTTDAADRYRGPSIVNHDDLSAVEAFEESFMRGSLQGQSWGPGDWS